MMKKTMVFGASPNPERYAYRAVVALRQNGHEVVAVGGRPGHVGDTSILTGHPEVDDVDTVTMYMGAERQREHYEYLLGLKPKRIIFNPGAENIELARLADSQDIEIVEGCTLVMLSIGNY